MAAFRSLLCWHIFLSCALTFGLSAPLRAAGSQDFTVYTVQEGDTLQALAQRFMGGTEFVDELLGYNRIENPASVQPGTLLAIPLEVRNRAITALSRAENALAAAHAAAADTYAAEEYGDARATIREARTDREKGSYSSASALAELGARKAAEAARLADERAPVQQEARITFVQGTAETSLDQGGTWSSARVGDTLPVAAMLRTGPDARVELTLAEGSIVQVARDSTFLLEDFRLDRRTGQRNSKLRVMIGNILGTVEPREVESSVFEIDSGNASIAIRGTQLRVGADAGATRLSMLEGATVITAAGASVDVPRNFGTVAEGNRPPARPVELFPPPTQLVPREAILITAVQTPTFSWHPVYHRRVDGYRLEIAGDLAFNAIVQEHRVQEHSLTADLLGEGDYFWRVSTVDRSGLEGRPTAARALRIRRNLDVEIEPASPLLEHEGLRLARRDNEFLVRPARRDTSVVALEFSLDGESYQPTGERIRFEEDGDYHLHVRGKAADGAVGEAVDLTLRVDGTAPEVTAKVSDPHEDPLLGEVVAVQLTASDAHGVARIEVSTDGVRFVEYDRPLVFSTAERVDLAFRATDILGNRSEVQSISVP